MGVNDTVKSSRTLAMGFERSDKSIQYIKIPNPSPEDATAYAVRGVMTYLTQSGLLLDSKTGEILSDTSVLTAYTEEKTTNNLDLS